MRNVLWLAAAGLMFAAFSDDELMARKMSGTWAFNQEMSPAFDMTGHAGRGRPRGGGLLFQQQGSAVPTEPRYPQGVRANPTNTERTDAASADLTPAQRAEIVAFRQAGLVLPTIAIDATATHVTFTDDRGDAECSINGKTEKRLVFGTWLDVKCRWDKTLLRQEFLGARRKLIRTWTVDDREMLVMKSKIEGLDQNTAEAAAFFDRVK